MSIELQGDRSELKSWSWYHGSISRQRAESLVSKDGEFIVRDCISHPGDFVLTCRSKGVPLHFMINCEVKEREFQAPEISYHFEDVNFNSVQDLVEFYRSHRKSITNSSGVVIVTPIARTMPLGYYDIKYGAMSNLIDMGQGHYSNMQSPRSSPYSSPSSSPGGSPKSRRKRTQRTGSQPLLSFDDGGSGGENERFRAHIDRCDSLPTIKLDRTTPPRQETTLPLPHYHQRAGSEPVLLPEPTQQITVTRNYLTLPKRMTPSNSDSNLSKPPPPKPSRIPSVKYKQKPKVEIRNKHLYDDDDGRDYSDYYQVRQEPSWLSSEQNNNITVDSRHLNGHQSNSPLRNQNSFNTGDSSLDDYDNNFNTIKSTKNHPEVIVSKVDFNSQRSRSQSDSMLDSNDYSSPPQTPIATINNSNYLVNNSSMNIKEHNKILRKKTITIPKHIESRMSYSPVTYTSCLLPVENKPLDPAVLLKVKSLILDVSVTSLAKHLTKVDIDVLKVLEDSDLGLGVKSGLELITLPHGKQLRQDIIERFYCLKVFVMIMILTCSKPTDRARMLSQWIQVAMELRSFLGNLFGFTVVMEALLAPQIQRLKDTWLILRQNHTSSAFLFDTKLKSFFKSLSDGSGLLPVQDVCIPDVSPLVWLMERDLDNIMDYLPWESSDPNAGLDIMLTHLDTARLITAQCGLYRVTTKSIFQNFEPDSELMEMFKTEFHLRILWGFKGSNVNRKDRQHKFEQLLTVLSDRAEVPGDDGTEV